jgi:hypothetical protein
MNIALSRSLLSFVLLVAVLAPTSLCAQRPSGWQDDLVDQLTGDWKLEGQVMGSTGHHDVQAEWVLNHQFLRIHEKTSASAPGGEHPYEATWFLGYDPVSERYVLHLLDVFGDVFRKHSAMAHVKATPSDLFSNTRMVRFTLRFAGYPNRAHGSG